MLGSYYVGTQTRKRRSSCRGLLCLVYHNDDDNDEYIDIDMKHA